MTRILYLQATVFPHPDDVVILRTQGRQQGKSPLAELVFGLMPAIGKKHRYDSIDDNEVEGEGRKVLLVAGTNSPKAVMGLPIGCGRCGEGLMQFQHGSACHELAQVRLTMIVQMG